MTPTFVQLSPEIRTTVAKNIWEMPPDNLYDMGFAVLEHTGPDCKWVRIPVTSIKRDTALKLMANYEPKGRPTVLALVSQKNNVIFHATLFNVKGTTTLGASIPRP